jgi:hypothetical protein
MRKTVKAWGVFSDCGLENVAMSRAKAYLQKAIIESEIYGPEYHRIKVRPITITYDDGRKP